MTRSFISGLIAGALVLVASLLLMYGCIYLFPGLMEEYYNSVFRSSSFSTDWLFYVHPFVLSGALLWFWERYKTTFVGGAVAKAVEVSLVYGVVAMLPVLLLTFSAINVSFTMVLTWFFYGIVQAALAGWVFAVRHS